MKNKTYGYVRVSTREQNEDRQMRALREFPVERSRIYMDKLSGKDFCRPSWQRLMERLKEGDLLVVKSIDRLGRNYDDILDQWRAITKDIGADIVVLDMPLLDTRQGKDLLGTLIGDLVLQLLSFVAQSERESINQRQAEGIAAAKQRGVRFGRPEKEMPSDFADAVDRWRNKELSLEQLAKHCGVGVATIYRKIKSVS